MPDTNLTQSPIGVLGNQAKVEHGIHFTTQETDQ
jgi:hypothetical protein